MGRTEKSIINVTASLFTNAVTLIASFIVQRIFIYMLGNEYNGINGLFTNIISMLSITELGIGTAIIYNLYKPVAENDLTTIKSLLNFYKKSYIVIAGALFCLGAIMMMFLQSIIGGNPLKENLYLIFMLFLTDCLLSYFLSYKRSILYAYQKNYILDFIHLVTSIIQNIIQIVVLIKYRNYIIYLLIKIAGKLIENIIISLYIDRNYGMILDAGTKPLSKVIKNDILTKVKALLLHRVGGFFVIGSDSIVITYSLGVLSMGLYTNYNLLLTAANSLLKKIFEVLTYVVGNFLVTSNNEQNFLIYKKIDLLDFWVFGWAATVMFAMFPTIISLWLGTEYILSVPVTFALVINFYLQGMRASIDTFKNAAGIFYEDRFVPLLEASVNIIVSVVCAKIWGLVGVFIGTIVSTGVLFFYSYPKYVCKPLFSLSKKGYVKQTVLHVLTVISSILASDGIISVLISDRGTVKSGFLIFFVSSLVFQLLFVLTNKQKSEFKYFMKLLNRYLFDR